MDSPPPNLLLLVVLITNRSKPYLLMIMKVTWEYVFYLSHIIFAIAPSFNAEREKPAVLWIRSSWWTQIWIRLKTKPLIILERLPP